MGKYNKNTDKNINEGKKTGEQKFYERVIQQIGALILHSVGATLLILVTILFGVKCATSGGYWVYLLSLIVCIAVTVVCIGAVILDTCNMLFMVKGLYDNNKKY